MGGAVGERGTELYKLREGERRTLDDLAENAGSGHIVREVSVYAERRDACMSEGSQKMSR